MKSIKSFLLLLLIYLFFTRYYTNQWIVEGKGRVPPHKDRDISDERNKSLKRYFPDMEDRKKCMQSLVYFQDICPMMIFFFFF